MFIGHYALGLAAKRVEPRLPLAVFLAAPQMLDLLWPIFVLLGIEHVEVAPGDTAFTPLRFVSYPWSHSLVMSIVWGIALGAVVRALGASLRGAGIVVALVVSHWVLDVASHRGDMPLWPGGGPLLGLGLWRSVPATLVVEIVMFAAGVGLYARSTRSKDRTGTWAYVGLTGFLFAAYMANVFGPPPPSATAVVVSGAGVVAHSRLGDVDRETSGGKALDCADTMTDSGPSAPARATAPAIRSPSSPRAIRDRLD